MPLVRAFPNSGTYPGNTSFWGPLSLPENADQERIWPWPVWLSRLEHHPVHQKVEGSILVQAHMEGNQSVFLSYISLPLSLPSSSVPPFLPPCPPSSLPKSNEKMSLDEDFFLNLKYRHKALGRSIVPTVKLQSESGCWDGPANLPSDIFWEAASLAANNWIHPLTLFLRNVQFWRYFYFWTE